MRGCLQVENKGTSVTSKLFFSADPMFLLPTSFSKSTIIDTICTCGGMSSTTQHHDSSWIERLLLLLGYSKVDQLGSTRLRLSTPTPRISLCMIHNRPMWLYISSTFSHILIYIYMRIYIVAMSRVRMELLSGWR